MSSKESPHPGDIYGQAKAHLAELRSRYPSQFSGEMVSCDWPDGWHSLVDGVCIFAAKNFPDVQWNQIKEKFGGLRMYYEGGDIRVDLRTYDGLISFLSHNENGRALPELQALIERTEAQSLKTCSLCGVSGEVDDDDVRRRSFGGWLLTACSVCEPKIIAHRELRMQPNLGDQE